MVSHHSVLASAEASASFSIPIPVSFCPDLTHPSRPSWKKEAGKSHSPLWTPIALPTHLCVPLTALWLALQVGVHLACFLRPTLSSVKAERPRSHFSTKDSSQQTIPAKRSCLSTFIIILNLNCRSSRGRLLPSPLWCGISQIPKWIRQYSQSVEKLFLWENYLWFLLNAFKRFAGSLLYPFSIVPGRAFLGVSVTYHKMEFTFLTFFGLF